MKKRGFSGVVVIMFASIMIDAALPVRAAPLAGLRYLVGAWKCTYRAGAVRLPYGATYVYDRDGHSLRQISTWAGGGDEDRGRPGRSR